LARTVVTLETERIKLVQSLMLMMRMMMFENRVLRRIFVPKRDELTREWRKLHNEELNDMYFSPIFFG